MFSSCLGGHCAPSFLRLWVPGGSSPGPSCRKGKGSVPEAETQLVSVAGMLKEEAHGGAMGAVWVWAAACPAGAE